MGQASAGRWAALSAAFRSTPRYMAFVFLTVIFALMLFGPFAMLANYIEHPMTEQRPLQIIAAVPFVVLFGLFFGWLVWGPIAFFTVIPGLWLFRASVSHSMAQRWLPRLGVAFGSVLAAVAGWAGFLLFHLWLGLLGLEMEHFEFLVFLLCLGAISALLAGQLLFPSSRPKQKGAA